MTKVDIFVFSAFLLESPNLYTTVPSSLLFHFFVPIVLTYGCISTVGMKGLECLLVVRMCGHFRTIHLQGNVK